MLVTGASRGIGWELAQEFASHGHDLCLVSRDRVRLVSRARSLEEQFGVEVVVMARDLCRPRAAERLFKSVRARGLEIEILVNNAGMMVNDEFVRTPLSSHLALLELNIAVPTTLTHLFLDSMLERGHGRVLNVVSMAGFQPLARLPTYAASKAYQLHLSEALSEELMGTGVTATALCPGFTDTEILSEAQDLSRLPPWAVGSARRVAQDGYLACIRGTPVLVSGALNQLAVQMMRYQPRWLTRSVSGALARAMRR